MIHLLDYINYFQHQCSSHPDLLHQDEKGKSLFELISLEESYGDFRSATSEKGYFFRLIQYDYEVSDNGSHQVQKRLVGGFIVGKHFRKDKGVSHYYRAFSDAEKIVGEFIEKMIADSVNGHPLFDHSLDSRQDIRVLPLPVTGDGSYVGWRVIFKFQNHFRNCITDPSAPVWTDGGQTPY